MTQHSVTTTLFLTYRPSFLSCWLNISTPTNLGMCMFRSIPPHLPYIVENILHSFRKKAGCRNPIHLPSLPHHHQQSPEQLNSNGWLGVPKCVLDQPCHFLFLLFFQNPSSLMLKTRENDWSNKLRNTVAALFSIILVYCLVCVFDWNKCITKVGALAQVLTFTSKQYISGIGELKK